LRRIDATEFDRSQDRTWTSDKEQKIEAFVARLLERGYLRSREISQDRPFLFDALVQLFGADACSRS
jgi:hypothetical protein